MSEVTLLGGTGMLGLAVHQALVEAEIEHWVSYRDGSERALPETDLTFKFDGSSASLEALAERVPRRSTIINCIGIVKAKIDESNSASVLNAIKINAELPHELNKIAQAKNLHVIQIATDCAYSGEIGGYNEFHQTDAHDVYGKSKKLGEVLSPHFMNLRVSIIGIEKVDLPTSLVEWVRNQPQNAVLNGFTNHKWNGITAHAFGKLTAAIVKKNLFEPGIRHIVPEGTVTKFELVQMIARRFGRDDLRVTEFETETPVRRDLVTIFPEKNLQLWQAAGYQNVPTVGNLVETMPTHV